MAMAMVKTDWSAAIKQIHAIENKYTSVMNISDDNPMMIKLHKIVHAETQRYHHGGRRTDYSEMKALNLVNLGYTYAEVAEKMHVSYSTIAYLGHIHHVLPKAMFHYAYEANNGTSYYAPVLESLNAVVDLHTSNGRNIKAALNKHGGKLNKGTYHWCELPIDSHYFLKGKRDSMIKLSNDSYGF